MEREEVNILIVDDVNTMRIQIKDLLRSFGFKKMVTVDGAESAKQSMAGEKFHLILCDWHMGVTSGIDFLKFIRNESSSKDVAFIMITAESAKEKVIEAIQAGVDDYLIKPLTLQQIETKVSGVLKKKQVIS